MRINMQFEASDEINIGTCTLKTTEEVDRFIAALIAQSNLLWGNPNEIQNNEREVQ